MSIKHNYLNTIILSYQDYWWQAAKKLKRNNIKTLYLESKNNQQISKEDSNCLYHDHGEASQCFSSSEKINFYYLNPPTPELLFKMSSWEREAYEILDRIYAYKDNLKVREAKRLFKKKIGFWESFIIKNKVNLAIFEEEPHAFSDYICYRVCKLMGIKTLLFTRAVNGKYFFPITSYEKGNPNIKKLMEDKNFSIKNLNKKQLNYYKDIVKDFDTCKRDYASVEEKIFVEIIDKIKAKKVFFIKRLFSKLLKINYTKKLTFLINEINPFIPRYKKMYRTLIKSNNANEKFKEMNFFSSLVFKIKTYFKMENLKSFYEKSTVNAKTLPKNFIFYGLHVEPEKTNIPLGGIFSDQIYVIEYLAKQLPEDWKIVVKEHKTQYFFKLGGRWGFKYRDQSFYERLKNNPKIIFVSMDSDPFKIIDKAKFIVTLTGNMGLEALIRNKKVLSLGYPWYRNHPLLTTPDFKNKKPLKSIIKTLVYQNKNIKISDLNSDISNANNRFACALSASIYKAYIGGKKRTRKGFTDNVTPYVQAVKDFIKDESLL